MIRRFLPTLGALCLALLLFAALAAVIAGRQTIHVQFGPQGDELAARGPDPLALLAEDVAQLRADLDAQTGAIADGLNALGDALHQDGLARQRSTQAELERLRAELAAANRRTEGLFAQLAAAEPAAARPAAEPVVAELGVAEPLVEGPLVEGPVVAEPAPSEPAASLEPEPARASFLAFELPTRALDFERPLRFAIVPSLSRVGFDATSTLHDFTGATAAVSGELETILARPNELSRGSVRVEAASLETGESDRDAEMREQLGVSEHPELVFEWTTFELDSADVAARSVRGTARGMLTIHGTTRPFTMPIRVGVDAGRRIEIEGQARLDMNDYGVEVPSKLGLISVDPEVQIWIALRARNVGAAVLDSAQEPEPEPELGPETETEIEAERDAR